MDLLPLSTAQHDKTSAIHFLGGRGIFHHGWRVHFLFWWVFSRKVPVLWWRKFGNVANEKCEQTERQSRRMPHIRGAGENYENSGQSLILFQWLFGFEPLIPRSVVLLANHCVTRPRAMQSKFQDDAEQFWDMYAVCIRRKSLVLRSKFHRILFIQQSCRIGWSSFDGQIKSVISALSTRCILWLLLIAAI